MYVASYSNFRQNLKSFMDKACNDFVPILIKRKNGKNAILLCEEHYKSMDETDYLLSNPANKKHLEEALEEDDKNNVVFESIKDFEDAFGI